jgi:hypothetical protein
VTSISGASYLYAFTAVVHGALNLFTERRMLVRKQPAAEAQVPFIDALQAVQTAAPVFDP